MLFLALSVAGCAAYFSVWGLSQLFAGASTAVIIMASILEIGKIVTTTALHNYWSKLSVSLRTYLTISVGILMVITSAGIYGFLSNAYQKTSNKLEIHEGELSVLDGKKAIFEKNVIDNQKIIESKNQRVSQLSGVRTSQESRLDASTSNRGRNNARKDISLADNEIQKLNAEIDVLNIKNNTLNDSINTYTVKSLELKSNSEIAGEVGPLKYISELTGASMAVVVNYLILLLIIVFDPLAVALILITNKIFKIERGENEDIVKDVTNDAVNDAVNDVVNDTVNDATNDIIPQEPITAKKKIELDDIKEIKERRGFSVQVPDPKNTNTIERIGSNKLVKNGDNNKVYFSRK